MKELQERRQPNIIYPKKGAITEKPIKTVTVKGIENIILDDLKDNIANYDTTEEHTAAINTFLEQQTQNKGLMLQGNFGSGKRNY